MIIIYLYDNIIQYKQKEEIKEYTFPKECMEYGTIKNIPIFETNLEKLSKKEKWNSLIKPKKIIIILPNFYTECNKEVIATIFQNIGIKNIKFKKENNLLTFKKNKVIINIHHKYLVLTKLEKNAIRSQFIPYYIFGNLEKTFEYIVNKNSKKERIFLIGSNNKLKELVENKKQNNILYFQDYKNYIINKYTP